MGGLNTEQVWLITLNVNTAVSTDKNQFQSNSEVLHPSLSEANLQMCLHLMKSSC